MNVPLRRNSSRGLLRRHLTCLRAHVHNRKLRAPNATAVLFKAVYTRTFSLDLSLRRFCKRRARKTFHYWRTRLSGSARRATPTWPTTRRRRRPKPTRPCTPKNTSSWKWPSSYRTTPSSSSRENRACLGDSSTTSSIKWKVVRRLEKAISFSDRSID